MDSFIYADNAATTKLDFDAFEAMKPYLLYSYGNASQPYAFGIEAKKAIKKAREIIATCICAKPNEIFFTSGGTESNNWAIKGSALCDHEKRVMITSKIEHHAVLNACATIERHGFPVEYLHVDKFGLVHENDLCYTITPKTRMVSIMYSNNEIGSIEPIASLCEISHRNGAIFHTDAVQAIGHIPIDVSETGVDMLSASAHKFNGPKGIGFLYIKEGTPILPCNDGGSQEFGMRAGTENVASIVGMAVALKKNIESLADNIKHIDELEHSFLADLEGLDYIRNGAKEHVPGNISLSFKGIDGETLLHRMDLKKICISTGSACDSRESQLSHVISAIHVPVEYAHGTIRVSLGKHNTIDDVHQIAKAIKHILLFSDK